ncbi:hypothetical protein LR48_Vigan07g187200 [Vigna angularis]|uniref:Uncharacterized protein n=1 Tax=Phaseolus angularis TaxID=3914 RepID=A0A0L9UZG0_PHAAN|nr:hypothetical protein LR48_Vigan07g187200 [Vigna angularis]
MASSSHLSRDRGKVVVATRNADLSGWISDEETRLEFTTKGWCFKDEDNMVQSSGSTPALNEDRTNFERFVVQKLRRLEQKIDALHQKKNKNDSPTEDSSEESSEKDSMEIF